MRAILAIARLTLREAIRSRLVIVFMLLLLLVTLGLPALLTGDGTPVGLVRMTVSYTLAVSFGLLAVATLWTGCALVSGDIAARTLILARVKPVGVWQFWLGKWIGLLLLNLLILTGLYSLTLLTVYRQMARDPAATAVMRGARLKVKPNLPSLDSQIDSVFLRVQGATLPPREQRDLRRRLRAELPFQAAALQRGQSWNWTFTLDRPPDPDRPIWLRFRFDTDAYTRALVRADCRLAGVSSGAGVDFVLDDFSTRVFEVPLAAEDLAADTAFTLTMTHTGDETTGPLLLQPRQGLDLLVTRTTLPANVLRAMLLHFALLALLAAIGVTCGTLFSLPVAAFCATGLLLAVAISTFVADDAEALHDAADVESPGLVQRVFTPFAIQTTRWLTAVAQPTLASSPLGSLAASELIPRHELRHAATVNLLLLPLVCCGVAALALRRRELPG
jgi:ABC-type transport system involved in multi-copper enzyme maturation permease subunit